MRRLEPAPGRLLIAAPLLTEDTFKRTVVYLLEHDSSGTVGVVINRPSRTPVGQVLPLWQDAVSEPSVVFGGGPVLVDGALCLGQVGGDEVGEDESSVRRLTDSLATVDLDADVALITGLTTQLRIFAGHAGWSAGQLDGDDVLSRWGQRFEAGDALRVADRGASGDGVRSRGCYGYPGQPAPVGVFDGDLDGPGVGDLSGGSARRGGQESHEDGAHSNVHAHRLHE